jgi:hypothetical protein
MLGRYFFATTSPVEAKEEAARAKGMISSLVNRTPVRGHVMVGYANSSATLSNMISCVFLIATTF